MTMPDPTRPRKPQRRFWLYAPYGVALIAALVWSAVWWMLAGQVGQRMDARAEALRARGWTVAWRTRTVSGFPFRLDVVVDEPRLADPSGWALSAPRLKGEAWTYAPRHWVVVAPTGLILTRPDRGAVVIIGQALRASVAAGDGQATPRIAVEGLGLTLTPAPGAKPLPITACQHLGFYLRPLPGDQAEFQLKLDGAMPAVGGLLSKLAPGLPIGLVWDQTLTDASALKGPTWPAAVRAWSAAGGTLSLNHGEISAADITLGFTSGRLNIDASGRAQGVIALDLRHAGAAPSRLGTEALLATLFRSQLVLTNGAMMVGPFKIGAAPKVY
jgi:hypothetical protein